MIALYAAACVASFLIIVVYISFFNKKDIWFLMSFMSLTICNTGYLALALSRTLEEALLANRIAYLGSVFLPYFLFVTIMKICRVRFPRWLAVGLSFINAAMLLLTMSVGYGPLYYAEVSFRVLQGAGMLVKTYGPLHSLYYVYLAGYFCAMVGVVGRAFFKGRVVSYKHALCLAFVVFMNTAIYFGEKLLSFRFEVLPFSYILAAPFLLFIHQTLEDYNIDYILQNTLATDSTGVVLFDPDGNYKGCNEDAAAIFPQLNELKLEYPVPPSATEVQKAILPALAEEKGRENLTYRHGGKIYRIVAKPFRRKRGFAPGTPLGAAVVISDDTTQQEYFSLITHYNERLEQEVAQKTRHIENMHDNLILGMADMVEGRDPNTGGHIKRTSTVVAILVAKMQVLGYGGLSDAFLQRVAKAAPMHDLGKIAIEDAVLRKPGKYTPEEYAVMRTHAERGAEIVGKILHREDDEAFYDIAVNVAHYHHEWFDGTGYPTGLGGAAIPIEARMMALADVFDALVSKRCYKEEYSYEEAFAIIEDSLEKQFDPELGRLFLSCKEELVACYAK